MYYVYILQSESGEHFYVGVTGNVNTRLKKHNSGSSPSTRPFRPWQVIYTETFAEKTAAYKREYHLKSPAGYLEKKALIEDNKIRSGEVA